MVRPATASPAPSGPFPRIGNLFWGSSLYQASPTEAEKVQLFLAPSFTPAQALTVQTAAPNTPILASINSTETVQGVPSVPNDSYYLHDIHGNKIQTWPATTGPGDFLLNLTQPAVVQFLANYAYQQMTQTGFVYNGIFFDNFETKISNVTHDVFGNPVQISSQNNGVADNPVALDAAWSTGLFNLVAAFQQLAPNAYGVGHIDQLPNDPRSLTNLNGVSFVFDTVDISEGTAVFGNLFDSYNQFFTSGLQPVATSVQSSPPSQIAYGYGFTPLTTALPSTITFGQTWYPNMRLGLAIASMNNGFFIHDLGDTTSPVTWWYDEYNFNLGAPVTPATLLGTGGSSNVLLNGGFESTLSPWNFDLTNDGSAAATVALDTSTFESGASSAHINVTSAGTSNFHVDFEQDGISLAAGAEYTVQFWAKGDSQLPMQVAVTGGAPSYASYGLDSNIALTTSWNFYSVSFIAPVTATDGELKFWFGSAAGNYWLDNVQLIRDPSRIYRRDFANGVVLLNATNSTQTISLENGLQHFTGSQAPKHQYIVDDASSAFTTTGSWIVDTFDTGFRTATGPYYHAWKSTCHELDTTTGTAQWNLGIPANGQYTIQVWLPAAPAASTWTKQATYQVIAGSQVLASVTLDQSQAAGGDQWYTIATNLSLTSASNPVLQISNAGTGPLIADAVYLQSASRLNDGTSTTVVSLQPMDGLLLQRKPPNQTISFAALPNKTLTAAPFQLSATASSSLPVTFMSTSLSVCTVSGTTVSLLNTGTCSITATQTGNATFTAAVPVSQSFTVAPSVPTSQTITFATIPNQPLGSNLTLSATASSGLPVSFSSLTTGTCTVSGNTATLSVAGTCTIQAYQPGNVFYAAAPLVNQSFTIVPGPPAVISITPSSGSGSSQTFAALFSDPNGGSDLTALLVLFNTTLSGTNGCYMEYHPSSNLIYLKNDANTAYVGSITPGSSATLSNSSCTVSGIGSSYLIAGTQATLNLALTFTHTTLNYSYLQATEINGSTTGWVQKGSWGTPANAVPAVVGVSPSSGSGTSQTFTASFTDTAGGANLNAAYMLLNTALSGTNGCYIEYFSSNNTLNLKNDANTGFVGSITPGSASTLSNSQCTVAGTGSSYSTSGPNATLKLALTFTTAFTQNSHLFNYLYASDKSGPNTGWVQAGTWGGQVTPVPAVVSITPSSGSGASQIFSAKFSDTTGGSSLNAEYALFNTTLSGTNGCYIEYFASSNTINLKNDANTGFVGAITPGSSATLSNSQCTVAGTGSSYSVAGTTATLNLALTFTGSSALESFLYASDKTGPNTGWVQEGTWTP